MQTSICRIPSSLLRTASRYVFLRSSSCAFPVRGQQRLLIAKGGSRESMEGKQQPPQQPLKPIDPMTKRYDAMEESYGEGYATFSNDEGFGGIYSSPVTVTPSCQGGQPKGASHTRDEPEIDNTTGKEQAQEFDCTQGSPVAEKERSSRHGVGFTKDRPS